ncbi:uncharacterized protein LOC110021619 [Phalaenopsis equestris]|uniref:uncharacterized protein LOC110021619 n=1 Tax=Phalaenopsis equestris TaxID=78828 RepID=UPI0009E29EFF|nr:uncharacterized protein LOC110021619 [Phalaenopsis equestris]
MASKAGEEQHPKPSSDIDGGSGNTAEYRETAKQKGDNPAPDGGVLAALVLPREEAMRLAIYIALAHGGLALSFVLLYGLARLLQDYRRPIQWALLCSMPLRELHTALVSFWSHPLSLGLPETLLAVPLVTLRSAASSLIDSHAALHRLFRRQSQPHHPPPHLGFSKLMRWLVSFAFFVLLHERLGSLALPVFALPGFLASTRTRAPPLSATLSAIAAARHIRRNSKHAFDPPSHALSRFSRFLTSRILRHLNTLIAINLILAMICTSLSSSLLFSYKISIEGRDAVVALKYHFQQHNYTERIGLQRWMDDHDVPELIESGASKLYDSVVHHVDSLALQYNVTELAEEFKLYLVKPIGESTNSSSFITKKSSLHPFSIKLRNLLHHIRNQEWRQTFADSDYMVKEFLSVLAREDLVEKIKGFALQSIDIFKQILASSTMVMSGSANLLFSISLSIISGAAGLLSFISQLFIFFWLLYSLITSESGVMDHALGMLPISKSKRVRCAVVLDHAVSSVMLAAVKVALFQGCFTYLLFRFYHIHFLYVSTLVACTSAILPITPFWLSSIPAAIQLVVEARYVEAVVLTSIHLIVLDYGTLAIQDEIPGQNAYLTGLSILGGMALFPSVLERKGV